MISFTISSTLWHAKFQRMQDTRRWCPSKYNNAQSRLINVSIENRNVICNRSSETVYFHGLFSWRDAFLSQLENNKIYSFLLQRWTFYFRMHRYLVRHYKQFTAATPRCTQAITDDKLNFNLSSYLIRHSFTNWGPSLAGKIAFVVFCDCFRKAGSNSLTLEEVTCNFAVRFATYNFEATVVRFRSTITGASYEFWSHTIAVVRSIFPSNFVHAKNTWKTHWTDLHKE